MSRFAIASHTSLFRRDVIPGHARPGFRQRHQCVPAALALTRPTVACPIVFVSFRGMWQRSWQQRRRSAAMLHLFLRLRVVSPSGKLFLLSPKKLFSQRSRPLLRTRLEGIPAGGRGAAPEGPRRSGREPRHGVVGHVGLEARPTRVGVQSEIANVRDTPA